MLLINHCSAHVSNIDLASQPCIKNQVDCGSTVEEPKFWSHGCIKVWLQTFCWILAANLFEVYSCKTVSRFWLHIRGYGITVSGFWSHNCRPTVATSDAWFPCRQCTGRTQAVRGVHSLDSLSGERSRQRWMSLGFRMCWFGTCI